MAEVTRQLGPLEAKIDHTRFAVERLFNSNGGPPGYLQTARKEDNDRFEMIFKILQEHKDDISPVKEFIRDHEVIEKMRDRNFRRYIAIWSLAVAIFMGLLALWDHKEAILHSLMAPTPQAHSELSIPQDAGIPRTR